MAWLFDPHTLRRELDRDYQRAPRRRLAFVGKRDGTIAVSGRPYYIYARAGSPTGPEYQVYDAARKAPRVAGAPIEVVERPHAPGRFEVAGASGCATPAIVAMSGVSPRRYEYGGSDMLIVDQRQIKQGKLRQNTPLDMQFRVVKFWYVRNGVEIVEVDELLYGTALVAAGAGLARWDLASYNPDTGELVITAGTAFAKDMPQTGSKPAVPMGHIPFGVARVDDETTQLREGPELRPYPPYFQLVDSDIFKRILTDDNGQVLTDDLGRVLGEG